MDPRLLKYYEGELLYLREMGGEFARDFPKIAGRLGMEGNECNDPYVERILEGVALLTARLQLKIDAEFPRFTQHLLEAVYPHYLAPIPSMLVARIQPTLQDPGLAKGHTIPRDSVLQAIQGKDDQTGCEYRTAHAVELWPVELVEAEYVPTPGALRVLGVPEVPGMGAGIRLLLRTTVPGLPFQKLPLQRLAFFLQGIDEMPMHLYEAILGNGIGMVLRPAGRAAKWQEIVPKTGIQRLGFREEEALLPPSPRTFSGYRLLQEYFAFPARYHFFELSGLQRGIGRCTGSELEIVVLCKGADPFLEKRCTAQNFSLFCTPAINLFPRLCDRIHLNTQDHEFHVVPDRTRPMDMEINSIQEVTGYGTSLTAEQEFFPFYGLGKAHDPLGQAYYATRREPRVLSSRQKRSGPRSTYIGSELFIALVDPRAAPYSSTLRQLGIRALCTNRDLPLQMPLGIGNTDFTLGSGGPIAAVRCAAGPSPPRPAWMGGDSTWRLISHLSLNYLSLVDSPGEEGAAGLRELLSLYGEIADPAVRQQIAGILRIHSVPVTRRLPVPGPICFGRGLEISMVCDEVTFQGAGVFLLGAVLAEFFARQVTLNSFTETVLSTLGRGQIMRWPARIGERPNL
jgi:type VI secretion system protein ImpG